jgi:D-alanyl-D-alanine carboxypeptidase/D-alanyl-D-alanine-endopeptidase (penicillin-binding protein 4)
MKLRLAALLCGVLAIACVAYGLRPTSTAAAAAPSQAPPAPVAPMLSPRRVPMVFTRVVDDGRLTRGLARVVAPFDACVAADAGTTPLARLNAATPLAPASTLKLLTATAALARLGPNFRFRTRFVSGPDSGEYVVVGGNDPLLATPQYTVSKHGSYLFAYAPVTSLDTLAQNIAASGVRTIATLGVDDSAASTVRYLPDWKPIYGEEGDVGSLGALVVDGGYAAGATRGPAPDPALEVGVRLAALLQTHGVHVAAVQRERAPSDAHEIAHIDSAPLRAVVEEMLTGSDDFTAEQILRELGNGDTTYGAAVVLRTLNALHVPTAGVVLHDGSGLARDDRVTCGALLAVVQLAATTPFAAINRGLPIAGRSGTLARRFLGDPLQGRLRAKTGTLDGVVGLAGFVDETPSLRFAFLAGGPFTTFGGQSLQTAVARLIAAAPTQKPTPASFVPVP